jgi:hypothetical protein
MALGPSWRQWQHWVGAVQRLDRGLLVYTKHRRMLRWIQIQLSFPKTRCT